MYNNIYEQKSIGKLIFTFSVPAIFSLVVEILTAVIDTGFAGHLGAQSGSALSAMGLIAPLLAALTAIQALFAVPTAIKLAKHLNNDTQRNNYYITGFCMTVAVAAATSVTIILSLTPVLSFLGASGEVLELAAQYMKIHVISNLFSAIGYNLTGCIRAFGSPKASTVIVVLAVVINIICNAFFTFGLELGIRGIALGTLVSEVVCAIISAAWLVKKKLWFQLSPIPARAFWQMTTSMLKIGGAHTIIMMLSSCTNFIANNCLLHFGEMDYVAAWNIVQNLYTLMMMPIAGIAQSVQTIIAYFDGTKQKQKTKKTIGQTMASCSTYGVLALGVILLFGSSLLNMFGATSKILSIASQVLKIVFITFPFVGIIYTVVTLLQVTGREVASVVLGLIRQLITVIPLMALLPTIVTTFSAGIHPAMAVFFAIPAADAISVLAALIFLKEPHKKRDKKNQTNCGT